MRPNRRGPRAANRRGGVVWLLTAGAVALGGCEPDKPTNQDFCDEVAIAAAQRSFDCAEDTDEANAAHDDVDALACRGAGDEASSTTHAALLPCTDAILATSCEVVKAHPREPVQHWMPAACGALLEGVAGAAGTTGGSL